MSCHIYEVSEHQKVELFLQWFQSESPPAPVVILVRARERVHEITAALRRSGVKTLSLHGSQKAQLRDSTWKAFTNGEAAVLVGTHALLRVNSQSHCATCVHFDLPEQKSEIEAQLEQQANLILFVSETQKGALVKWAIDFPAPPETKQLDGFNYASVGPKKKVKSAKTPKKGPRSKPLQNKKPKLNPKWGR